MNRPPPLPASPELLAELIEQSLRAFTLSLYGLIPLLGIPFAVLAVFKGWHARRLERDLWNPARGYRRTAVALGVFSALLGSTLHFVLVMALLTGRLGGG